MDDENTAAVIVLEDEVLAIGQDDCCTVSDPYVEWVIDSAASCHVTPRKELFTSYKAGNFGRVKMAMIVMPTLWELVIYVLGLTLDTP